MMLQPYSSNDVRKPLELWRQDFRTPDLWHGPQGLLVNTSALNERAAYFELVRLPVANRLPSVSCEVKGHSLRSPF